jgi:sugar/nucleoside kinase (ribokinase family)
MGAAVDDRAEVLIAGHVTWDVTDGRRVPGGSVCYAARAAASMGVRARILAGAGPDADLTALEGHDVEVVATEHTLTLEHDWPGGERRQSLRAAPGRMLSPDDLPERWPQPDVAILGPLVEGDLDPALATVARQDCALIGQGFQRVADESGAIRHLEAPSTALKRACSPLTSLFLSDVEVAGWPSGELERLVSACRRVVITYGERGVVVHRPGGIRAFDALRVEPVDVTGAGDVYASAFILGLDAGEEAAARLAAGYAAAAVRVQGAGLLPPRAEVERMLREGRW